MARASIALAALSPTLQAIRRKEPYDSQTLDTTQQDTYQTSPSSSPALVALPLASSRVRRSRTPSLSSRRLQALPTSGPGLAPPSNLSCSPWLLPSESRSVSLASHAAGEEAGSTGTGKLTLSSPPLLLSFAPPALRPQNASCRFPLSLRSALATISPSYCLPLKATLASSRLCLTRTSRRPERLLRRPCRVKPPARP